MSNSDERRLFGRRRRANAPADDRRVKRYEVTATAKEQTWLEARAAVLQVTVPRLLVESAMNPNVRTDTDNGWSLEAVIPWPNFEELSRRPPAAGTVWKVNFNRWDGVEPTRRMSIWSDPQNSESWPHVPSRFGEIVFVD